jgi:hypothetical protein
MILMPNTSYDPSGDTNTWRRREAIGTPYSSRFDNLILGKYLPSKERP